VVCLVASVLDNRGNIGANLVTTQALAIKLITFYTGILTIPGDATGNIQEVAMGHAHELAMSTGESRFKPGIKPRPGNHGRQPVNVASSPHLSASLPD
jgi:hypothetical protein